MDSRNQNIVDGVNIKTFFDKRTQAQLFEDMEDWFQKIKDTIPQIGIYIYSRYDDPKIYSKSQIELPKQVIRLIDAMLKDAIKDPANKTKPIAKILLERTGINNSHKEDFGYHVDTKQVYWDEDMNRIGYDPERGPDKYMVFVGRPGSFLIEGKIDKDVTRAEIMKLATLYAVDLVTGQTVSNEGAPAPHVVQLESGLIYKVEVGSILHAPPPHDDGLLITLSMIDEIPDMVTNLSK